MAWRLSVMALPCGLAGLAFVRLSSRIKTPHAFVPSLTRRQDRAWDRDRQAGLERRAATAATSLWCLFSFNSTMGPCIALLWFGFQLYTITGQFAHAATATNTFTSLLYLRVPATARRVPVTSPHPVYFLYSNVPRLVSSRGRATSILLLGGGQDMVTFC